MIPTGMPRDPSTSTILYDPDCGFCRWALAHLLAVDRNCRLRPMPLGTPEANALLASDPMALLIGFLLDQQVSVLKAFGGPLELKRRIGTLDAGHVAQMDPAALDAAFRKPPALHRFPGSMAAKAHDLAAAIVERYDGDPTRIWSEASDGADLERPAGRQERVEGHARGPGGDGRQPAREREPGKRGGERAAGRDADRRPEHRARERPRHEPHEQQARDEQDEKKAARRLVLMVDHTKLVAHLGRHWALPVEVVPFGWTVTAAA